MKFGVNFEKSILGLWESPLVTLDKTLGLGKPCPKKT